MDAVERERARELIAWAIALVGCLIALCLSACNTVEAVGQLPEGYWLATERLLLAVLEDVLSVVRWLLPL